MMKVGLTGGIGSGKTEVGKMFAALGVPVYNADDEAKKILRASNKVREAIIALLGNEAYKEGAPDRGYIAGRVFGNAALLGELNKIVHPAVRQAFTKWTEDQKDGPYVVQEAAILFENGAYKEFDRMILVCAPVETRILRTMERDGSSREATEARMAHQWDDKQKLPLADFVIQNQELSKTRKAVGEIHRQLVGLAGTGPF